MVSCCYEGCVKTPCNFTPLGMYCYTHRTLVKGYYKKHLPFKEMRRDYEGNMIEKLFNGWIEKWQRE